MSEIIYEFTSLGYPAQWWDDANIIDGVETSYAYATGDEAVENLDGNECVGTDLGTISKVELRFYGYGDADDEVILTPVFGGSDDGDDHEVVPGVTAGWKAWQDITSDTNSPRGVYESFATGGDTDFRLGGAWWAAQTFTPASGHDVGFVEVYIEKAGSPGDVTVSIRAVDGDNKPTGDDLASGTVSESDIGTTKSWIRFVFTSPTTLVASTMYAIVLRAPSGDDVTNYIDWHFDYNNGYADGTKANSSNSGSSWGLQTNDDFCFREGTWWAWSDVQNLDCDVRYNKVGKGNTMYVGMVQARVTYELGGPPPPTGQRRVWVI